MSYKSCRAAPTSVRVPLRCAVLLLVAIAAIPLAAQQPASDAAAARQDSIESRMVASVILLALPVTNKELDEGLDRAGFAAIGKVGGWYTNSFGFSMVMPASGTVNAHAGAQYGRGSGSFRTIDSTQPMEGTIVLRSTYDVVTVTAALEIELKPAPMLTVAPRLGLAPDFGFVTLKVARENFRVEGLTPESMLSGDADATSTISTTGFMLDLGVDLRVNLFRLDSGTLTRDVLLVLRSGYLLDLLSHRLSRSIGTMERFNASRFYLSIGVGFDTMIKACRCDD
jgi:hypothetical protein